MAKDYYQTLDVDKTADSDAIKRAYRKLAMKYHPDRNPGDATAEERFKDVSEAYAVLSDAKKRQQYDQFGSDRFQQNFSTEDILRDFNIDDIMSHFGMKGTGRSASFKVGGGGGSFFDLFGGGAPGGGPANRPRPRRPAPKRGRDAELAMEVSFYEAMHGSERQLNAKVAGERRSLTVHIPAGIETGKKLRIKGEGHPGAAGPGDLLLDIKVAVDPRFERRGQDLHTRVEVTASTLLLGGSVEVQTLKGTRTLKVKAGSASGKPIRIRGAGAPKLGNKSTAGDLYVRLEVTPPDDLTDAQTAAAKALRDTGL